MNKKIQPYYFDIIEEDGIFFLIENNEKIKCKCSNALSHFFTEEFVFDDEFVSDKSESLIQYIKDDFFKFGEVEINKGKIKYSSNPDNILEPISAYDIFSNGKALYDSFIDQREEEFKIYPMYDESLIVVSNGPEVIQQMSGLSKIKSILEKKFGADDINELMTYSESNYFKHSLTYQDMIDNPDIYDASYLEQFNFISTEDFLNTNISKKINYIISDLSLNEKRLLSSLFINLSNLGGKSILLSLALIKKWLSISEFIVCSMHLGAIYLDMSHMTKGYPSLDKDGEAILNKDGETISMDSSAYQNETYKRIEEVANSHANYLNVLESDYTDIEKIMKKGEGFKLEAKSTLFHCMKEKKFRKDLGFEVIRAIAGFLNAKGGTLLVGVEEDNEGLVCRGSLDEEINKHCKGNGDIFLKDKFAPLLDKFLLKGRASISADLISYKDHTILKVDVKEHRVEVWVEGEKHYEEKPKRSLFRRQEASTVRLDGEGIRELVRAKVNYKDKNE